MSDGYGGETMATPVGAGGSRGRTAALVAVAIVVLVVAALVGAWVYFTRTPAYSLGLLAQSAAEKDWAGVQRYADVRSIAEAGVDQAVAANLPKDSGVLGDTAKKLAEAAKPALVRSAIQAFKAAVESGRFANVGRTGPLTPLAVARTITSSDVSGDTARVRMSVPMQRGTPVRLDLRMKRTGVRWRVVEVLNSNEVLDQVTQ